jgi:replicative DNA helicase
MLDLYERKEPIDVLSVASRLKEKKCLDKVGRNSYLAELVNCVPTASNVKHYAEIVRKKSVLRNLIESSEEISQLGYNEEDEIDEILDSAERKIFSIARYSLRQKFLNIKEALEEAWGRFERLHKTKGELRGIPTGFPELDNILAGFQKSDLIILAARPSMGKTALALDIARNIACRSKIPVGIFSLEMSAQQLVDRLLSAEAHVDSWKLRTGRLSTDDEFSRIRDALDALSSAPIFIDDEASNNIMQMRAKAGRLQTEYGLGLLIVDYIQLMVPRQRVESAVQQMTEISRSLKGLARELEVPVLAISQLSRAVESRHPPIPKLHDLRDSGSIEQDADVVMFIYREDRYKENSEKKNVAEIFVEKHRNGPLGKVEFYFNPQKVSFSSMEKGDFGQI